MQFQLYVNLGSDGAAETDVDIADALRRTADAVEQHASLFTTQGPIRDVNGNTVGAYAIHSGWNALKFDV